MTTTSSRTRRPLREYAAAKALDGHAGNPLQLLLAQRMTELGGADGPLSLTDVVERSGKRRDGKHRVSKVTVGNILRGRTVKLTADTVTALARALDLEPVLIEQAIVQSTELTMEIPPRLRKLSPEAWKAMLQFGDHLLAQEGKSRGK